MRLPGWMFVLGAVVLVGITGVCALVSFVSAQRLVVDLGNRGVQVDNPLRLAQAFINNRDTLLQAQSQNSFDAFVAAQPTPTRTPIPLVTSTPPPGVTPQPTQEEAQEVAQLSASADIPEWNDPRRFTILLLGIDQRTGVEDNEQYFRTDTIMVISVDPVRERAGIISIPRDLWVSIPGYREGRINTANALGDSGAYPGGGGPALAAAAVQENLGIEIDKYILINFDVFTSVVNLVAPEGVEICVRETIDDPTYPDAGYGFLRVHFDPGCQRLNAEKLLQYARTRHTDGGDFDRARRQQEVIRALRDEVLSAGGIANFVTQIQPLWDELSGSFRTNMTLEEIISLGGLAQDIDDSMTFGVIDNLHVQFTTTSSGDQVLLPNYAAIRGLISDTFDPPEDLPIADLRQRSQEEGASIVVFNNTDTAGLARQSQEWLLSQGITVESVGNMPQPTNLNTEIRIYTDKPWTARYLAALLGLPNDRIVRSSDGLTSADVMIVIGPDIQPLLTGE